MKRALLLAVLVCWAAFGQYGGGSGAACAGSSTGQRAFATASSTQSLANSTNQKLSFDTNVFDTNSFHSTSVNPTRFTVPAGLGGVYMAWGELVIGTSASGLRAIGAWVNGSQVSNSTGPLLSTGTLSNTQIFSFSTVLVLSDGDYMECNAFQGSGGAINAAAGTGCGLLKLF